MNFNHLHRSAVVLAIFAMASCKPEFKDVTPSKGSADFSRYIAVGNSLTAGFADGGLYLDGQKNSYPEMIATQLKAVGGGEFYTPFFNTNQADGSGYLRIRSFSASGLPVTENVLTNTAIRGQIPLPAPIGNVTLYTKYSGEINNYGVPGIKLTNIDNPGYGNANGYFERLLPAASPGNTTSYLSFITAKPFTFFSMWLGNNDILSYATSGGAGDVPTDKARFNSVYQTAVNALTASNAKGVVATIPDVLSTPYFNTVTLASLLAAVQATAPTVTNLYIRTGAGAVRAATAQDRFVLTLGSANVIGVPNAGGLPYGLHPGNAIESKWVLDNAEAALVNDYVNAYNTTIRSVAAAKGLALMDAYALLKEYGAGKAVNGVDVSAAFITGNLFSLDGIHLTPMGYAIIANAFIKSINAQYGASVPIVDVTRYRGVIFP